MSCVTVPTLASDGMELWRRALRSESGKRHSRVAASVATSIKNAACTPMPHGPQTVPNLIPRVNSLLTMAKGRLAEHFREDRLGLLRQCGFKSNTRGGTVLRSFGVVWRQLQVRLLTPKALMYWRPSIFG